MAACIYLLKPYCLWWSRRQWCHFVFKLPSFFHLIMIFDSHRHLHLGMMMMMINDDANANTQVRAITFQYFKIHLW